jgi:hypothetical protein
MTRSASENALDLRATDARFARSCAFPSRTNRPHESVPSPGMLRLPKQPRLADRAAVLVAHWRNGSRFGIPVCCRARFCIDVSLGRAASVVRWREISAWDTPISGKHVPCGLVHQGYSHYGFVTRLVRIIAFQIALGLPGNRCAGMRRRAKHPGPTWFSITDVEKSVSSRAGLNGQIWWSREPSPITR